MQFTRKDIQFIAICIGATALVFIAAHLFWAPPTHTEGVQISRPEVGQYAYVASIHSEVFLRPSCRWVRKIKPANLIGFKTREEAIKSGRRPCKVCKP